MLGPLRELEAQPTVVGRLAGCLDRHVTLGSRPGLREPRFPQQHKRAPCTLKGCLRRVRKARAWPTWRPSLAVNSLQFFDLILPRPPPPPPRSPENFNLRLTFFKSWFKELLRISQINPAKGQRWSQPGDLCPFIMGAAQCESAQGQVPVRFPTPPFPEPS